MIGNIDNFAILAPFIEKEHCTVLSFTATEFFSNPGRRNQEVPSELIEVKSYGRIVGYYLSPSEYNRLINAACRASEPGAYNSTKDLAHARRHDILSLAKKYGITRIRIYFLVEFPENKPFSEDDFEFICKLQEMFGKRRVDVVRLEMIDKRLKKSILDGAIKL
ncbi:nucleotidyltransferase family protein [Bartonella sp. B10]